MDSKLILQNPKGVLQQFCELIGVSFYENMLQWEKGPRKEDGVWAKYWYQRVHASGGWEAPMSPRAKAVDVSLDFPELLAEIQPLFRRLQEHITI